MNPTDSAPQGAPEPKAPAPEAAQAEQPEKTTPQAINPLLLEELRSELNGARAELAAAHKEREQQGKRLDEIARAYSGLLADQKEFRQRLEREKERVLLGERGKVALGLLELGDELERALSAARQDEGPLAQGVRLIREGLLKRLSAMGIERMELVGKPYDPELAEAVDLVPVADKAQDDTVVAEAVPGYRLGERVLRPARVRVARYMAPPAQPAQA